MTKVNKYNPVVQSSCVPASKFLSTAVWTPLSRRWPGVGVELSSRPVVLNSPVRLPSNLLCLTGPNLSAITPPPTSAPAATILSAHLGTYVIISQASVYQHHLATLVTDNISFLALDRIAFTPKQRSGKPDACFLADLDA